MKLLHIAGGFAKHPLYTQLVMHLQAHDVRQTIFAAVRSEEEASKQPLNQEGMLKFHLRHILRPAHRVFFRSKSKRINRELLDCVDPMNFDVVHAHTLYSDGAVALKLHETFGIPYIVAVRNTDLNVFMRFRPDLRWIANSVLRKASQVVFLSPAYRQELLGRLSSDLLDDVRQKSIVLGNGLDSFWLEPQPIRAEIPETPLRLLYVGDFSSNKNVENTLRAAANLNVRMPVRLTLVGSGGCRENHIRAAINDGQYPFAEFIGRVRERNDLRSLYRSHHVFVMPSIKETFGVVYVEALSQGLPIVCSKGQGVDGFFRTGTVCEVVNPQSVESIISGIELVAARRNQVRPICINEANNFSWKTIAKRYDETYRKSCFPEEKP